jgi:hypothetical protein
MKAWHHQHNKGNKEQAHLEPERETQPWEFKGRFIGRSHSHLFRVDKLNHLEWRVEREVSWCLREVDG